MRTRCEPDENQMGTRCEPDAKQMRTRCEPDANQMRTGCEPDDMHIIMVINIIFSIIIGMHIIITID